METEIYLIGKFYETDDIGQQIETETKRPVFANIESVGQNEFFKAGKNGLRPSFKCIIWDFEYDNEDEVEFNGDIYCIYRTFIRSDEHIELYVEMRTKK